jgi:hypothetical protein
MEAMNIVLAHSLKLEPIVTHHFLFLCCLFCFNLGLTFPYFSFSMCCELAVLAMVEEWHVSYFSFSMHCELVILAMVEEWCVKLWM